jgi:ion channel POLLUX/CASTOR
MNKATLADRLRYEFDNYLSRGMAALIAALLAVTACLILSTAGILVATGLGPADRSGPLGFAEAIWLAATRVLDSGAFVDDSGWSYRLVGFLVTLGGIFLSSALIGILVSGLDQRLDKLRRGRTRVVETGHTLILGWSPHIYTILEELAWANRSRGLRRQSRPGELESQPSACVVILADEDRLEMEEEIRLRVPGKQGTRVVCRSGDPLDSDILKIVSPETARAIIILSPGGEHPDLPVGRALLAVARNQENAPRRAHIVAAVQHLENLQVMRMIGGERAQIFLVDRLLGSLIAQACLQPGLGLVFTELLHFQGANINFVELPALAGERYGKALDRLENATLIGLQSGDRLIHLNPPLDTPLQPGDRLIVIQKNGIPIQVSTRTHAEPIRRATRPDPLAPHTRTSLLILGWNERAPIILEHLSLAPHSGLQVKVFAPVSADHIQAGCFRAGYGSLQVTFEEGNPQDRPSLERLVSEDCAYVLILSSTSQPDTQLADVFNVVSYLHLRDIARKTGRSYSILRVINFERKGDQSVLNDPGDATVSNQLVALILAQMAENKDTGQVLAELLGPGGTPILLKPAGDYVAPGEAVDFQTVIAAARCQGETAIGYRLLSEASQAGEVSGVHLNPDKSAPIIFQEQDNVIVLSNGGEHLR